jgi:ADP-ribose pyrophosphatase
MGKILREKEVGREVKFSGRLLTLRVDTVELPHGKKTTREVVEHPGAVAVVAVTQDNELVLVRQYRKPAEQLTLELPAGCLKKGEAGVNCARRELEEETGFYARKITKLCSGFATPGYSNEIIHLYLAEDMNRMQAKPDEDELLEIELVDIEVCVEMVKQGKINDLKTMLGILFANTYIKGLENNG